MHRRLRRRLKRALMGERRRESLHEDDDDDGAVNYDEDDDDEVVENNDDDGGGNDGDDNDDDSADEDDDSGGEEIEGLVDAPATSSGGAYMAVADDALATSGHSAVSGDENDDPVLRKLKRQRAGEYVCNVAHGEQRWWRRRRRCRV